MFDFEWKKGKANPVSNNMDIIEHVGELFLRFLCPTCEHPMSIRLKNIEAIVGIPCQCDICDNLSFIPSVFSSEKGLAETNEDITGSVIVPIKEYSDFYLSHPIIKKMIEKGESELLSSYGLRGFCASCFHNYRSTVLNTFPVMNIGANSYFNVHSAESATDMTALSNGGCPACGSDKLVVIVTSVPTRIKKHKQLY